MFINKVIIIILFNSMKKISKIRITQSLIICMLLLFCLVRFSDEKKLDFDTKSENKFREREASDDAAGYPNLDEDELLNTECPQHLELRWQTEVRSSIYATPLIADINSDGKLEIVVPSFVHYLEVLEGSDGEKMPENGFQLFSTSPGWPAFHQSTSHSSPLLYDIDEDGVRDIALATYNGEVLFFGVSGYMMTDKLEVPRLKVKKDWYVGLLPDPVDRSHPDVHDDLIVEEAMKNLISYKNGSEIRSSTMNSHMTNQANPNGDETVSSTLNSHTTNQANPNGDETVSSTLNSHTTNQANPNGNETLSSTLKLKLDNLTNSSILNSNGSEILSNTFSSNKTIQADSLNGNETVSSTLDSKPDNLTNASDVENQVKNNDTLVEPTTNLPTTAENGTLDSGSVKNSTTENETSSGRRLLQDDASGGSKDGGTNQAATVENDGGLEEEADSSFDLFRDDDVLADDYNYDYDDDDDVDESMWGDEDWTEPQHENMENYVNVDSHILGTPVIADIDNDGVSEMVVAVSYFFDPEYYDNPEHAKELGGIDIGKYVAGGIVVFNLNTKQVKWATELDHSTNTGKYRAYIYTSPTVIDLDGDGNMDILIGTSYGMFYVLDHKGKVRDKFPLEMAELQGAVVAGDINDDGKIELVTADTHGNVAAWTAEGKEIWETHIKSLVPQAPTIGDVDGDGRTDVVVPTLSGNIYVLSGKDGSVVRPYPYRTHGQVMNQVLLVDLSKRGEKKKGLTIVTTSFDGYLYLIDGPTSCADVVDIGETSYSMVLADNVDGGDDLDLIVTTMNGNVFCFSTPSQHHPLKAWKSHNQGQNNVANRFNRQGIHILPSSRAYRDEEGKTFWVEIEIIDKYRFPSGFQGPYNVTTSLLVPGNYVGDRIIKQSQVYKSTGKYRIKLPTVKVRTTGTVLVEMFDKNGVHFSDEFSLTFHMYYYRLLKWIIVLPMLGMFGVLVILKPQDTMPLPSFSRNTDL